MYLIWFKFHTAICIDYKPSKALHTANEKYCAICSKSVTIRLIYYLDSIVLIMIPVSWFFKLQAHLLRTVFSAVCNALKFE